MTTDYDQFRTHPLPAEYRAKWVAAKIMEGTFRSEVAVRKAIYLEIKAAEDALAQRYRNDRDRAMAALDGATAKRKPTKKEVCAEYFREHPNANPREVARMMGCTGSTARAGRLLVVRETGHEDR